MDDLDQLAGRVEDLKGREAQLRVALVAAGDLLDGRANEARSSVASLRQEFAALREVAPAEGPLHKQLAYLKEVAQVRRAVDAVVPADATVLVVSKGDEDLLSLGGRRAWHFPRGEGGVYAGHYPANGADAVAHLEALRADGAGYLALPSAAFWWLDHYPEFRRHLESRCTRVHGDGHCQVYRLAPAAADADRNGPAAGRDLYREMVGEVRAAVRRAMPTGAVVLVVSKGDDELVRLGGCEGWHFPKAEDGAYTGHHPADAAEAVVHLERLRARGADFLLFPNTAYWWLTYYRGLRDHLDTHYRRVRADEWCILYDLSGGLLARLLGRSRGRG